MACLDKVKIGILHQVQQSGSYWDRFTTCGSRTAKLAYRLATEDIYLGSLHFIEQPKFVPIKTIVF